MPSELIHQLADRGGTFARILTLPPLLVSGLPFAVCAVKHSACSIAVQALLLAAQPLDRCQTLSSLLVMVMLALSRVRLAGKGIGPIQLSDDHRVDDEGPE